MSLSPSFRNPDGSALRLLATPLAQGGEGVIFAEADAPGSLVKIYHRADPAATQARVRKLTAMLAAGPELRAHPRLAWPQFPVLGPGGDVVGYRMRRMQGISLVPLSAPVMFRRDLPHWNQRHVVRVAHDLASLLGLLERHQIFPGDLNLNNAVTRPEDGETSLIDCDSFQIGAHPCRVLTPDFAAPEILAHKNGPPRLGPESLRFSAALFLFYILTQGLHPYQVRGGETPEANILAGRIFLGSRGQATGSVSPALYARYRALPPRLAWLFKQAFIEGHSAHPDQRPSFPTWVEALRSYYRGLSDGSIAAIY